MVSRDKREISVEDALRHGVERADGLCVKLNPSHYVGIPDRLVLLPRGRAIFVELKRPKGGVLSSMQKWWGRRLRKLGFMVVLLDTREAVEEFLAAQ